MVPWYVQIVHNCVVLALGPERALVAGDVLESCSRAEDFLTASVMEFWMERLVF